VEQADWNELKAMGTVTVTGAHMEYAATATDKIGIIDRREDRV
jgi:hypothetical protein